MDTERHGPSLTCITCRVVFARGELQREHYKTDWHRYNLKRKVAELPPVTAETFRTKVLAFRDQNNTAIPVNEQKQCKPCNKTFRSNETYVNHCNSKKHKETLERSVEKSNGTEIVLENKSPTKVKEELVEVIGEEEEDSDWEDGDAMEPEGFILKITSGRFKS